MDALDSLGTSTGAIIQSLVGNGMIMIHCVSYAIPVNISVGENNGYLTVSGTVPPHTINSITNVLFTEIRWNTHNGHRTPNDGNWFLRAEQPLTDTLTIIRGSGTHHQVITANFTWSGNLCTLAIDPQGSGYFKEPSPVQMQWLLMEFTVPGL